MPKKLPTIHPVAEVTTKNVDWLWEPYIPVGFVTVFAGPKWAVITWINLATVTALSRGNPLPGQSDDDRTPCSCLYISSEDTVEYILRPRLESLEADISRICVLNVATGMDRLVPHIEPLIASEGIRYIIIDPLLSFIPSGRSSISSEDMRAILDPLGELANTYDCAINVTTHLSKYPHQEAIDRISGSAQIAAQGRSILLADKDRSDNAIDTERVLVHAGTNLGPSGPSLKYSVEDGIFTWIEGPAHLNADEMFGDNSPLPAKYVKAAQFLVAHCQRATSASELEALAEVEGISRRTLYRAARDCCTKQRMGVASGAQKTFWTVKPEYIQ